ncbi:hypothetical protein AURDEDRAFT_172155 [Auricularia subglabra TFB-10046 SS5]|nr:hypothetical protein AURDEDRAFT_172155 [Auricularia subglabra TFB-10046 SS5]
MEGPAALEQLFASLERGTNVHYLHVSAAFLFIYDYFTTFSDEVDLIWKARCGPGKLLFLVVRYVTWPELLALLYIELFDVSTTVCYGVFKYSAWSLLFGITASEMVLILRTWAIWGARRSTLLLLSLLLLAVTIVNCYIVEYYIEHTTIVRGKGFLPGVTGCILVHSTRRVGVAWICETVFELVIVVLTLIKGIEHFKTSSLSLFPSLYRDGVLYFVFLFTISLVNMTVLFSAAEEYIILLAETQRAFHALLACRIILHLRSAAATRRVDAVARPGPFGFGIHAPESRSSSAQTRSVSAWFGNESVKTPDHSTFEMTSTIRSAA